MRSQLKDKKRVVVKIGTSSLTFSNGRINFKQIDNIAAVLSRLNDQGREVVLVSSGSIAVGSGKLGYDKKPDDLTGKQAMAAIGQAELMKIYQKFFGKHNKVIAQVLVTKDGMEDPKRGINARNTFLALLSMGVIPIVNENDTIATEEIEYGDNDTLSACVATLIDADLLVLLSDIDGLFTADPRKDPSAKIISIVGDINADIDKVATGAGSAFGTGGMNTKIAAARICRQKSIGTVITNGKDPSILFQVLEGADVGTYFLPA